MDSPAPEFTWDKIKRDRSIQPGTLSVGFVESFRIVVHGNTITLGKMSGVTRQGDWIVVTPSSRP